MDVTTRVSLEWLCNGKWSATENDLNELNPAIKSFGIVPIKLVQLR